jgi:CRP/FNR family cyclic AMP-dependent transcriptional regulator
MDLKIFLKNLPSFEDFNAEHLDLLAGMLKLEEHESGHVFIRQGVQGEALFLVIEGAVAVTRREGADGEDMEVRELHNGELFGVLSLVDDLPASATCTAKGKVQSAALTHDAFDELFRQASSIGHRLQFMIAGQMARDLRELNRTLRASIQRA